MYENNFFCDRGEIEEKIKKTASEIETLVESENFDKKKYTKLMFQQLMQGLYLQNVNMY
jgi:hypothetical protein